jgi:hypothetical protein
MPVPVVAYDVAWGSGALASIAAALEDATPAARRTASEDSMLARRDVGIRYGGRNTILQTRRGQYLYLFLIHVGTLGALGEVGRRSWELGAGSWKLELEPCCSFCCIASSACRASEGDRTLL